MGNAYGLDVVLEESLAGLEEVYFEGGDHRSLVKVGGGAVPAPDVGRPARTLRHARLMPAAALLQRRRLGVSARDRRDQLFARRRDRHGHRLAQGISARAGVDRHRAYGRIDGHRAGDAGGVLRKGLHHLIGVMGREVRPAHQEVVAEREQRVQLRGAEGLERRNGRRAAPPRPRATAARPRADRWSAGWPGARDRARASPGRCSRADRWPAPPRSSARADRSGHPPCWCRSADACAGTPATGDRACERRSRTRRSRPIPPAGTLAVASGSCGSRPQAPLEAGKRLPRRQRSQLAARAPGRRSRLDLLANASWTPG